MGRDKETKWRKIGKGSLRYIRGRIIKPNEVFFAREDEIPKPFRKFVVAVEDVPEEYSSPVQSSGKDLFRAQKRPGTGWWDIINITTGKKVNEKGLRQDRAEALVKEFNA